MQATLNLPLPEYYDPRSVGEIWRVDYQIRARDAHRWREQHRLCPAAQDKHRIALLLVDVQNTFCIPDFELFVAGRGGDGAVADNARLCPFIYRNLNRISTICPTLDTHQAMQIFHNLLLINTQGQHPEPFTTVTVDDLEAGIWRFNPAAAEALDITPAYGQRFLQHYTQTLAARGKYQLTIWPYHAMLGGIGHALVAAVEEAVFFHGIARFSQPDFQIKGRNPLTENYSALRPEVLDGPGGEAVDTENRAFIRKLLDFDAVIIAGQAKSHCVAWTVEDLLAEIMLRDPRLARKIYLLEDCTSPVVIPGVVDYSDTAQEVFARFAKAGMHLVDSSTPMDAWPDMPPA
jgi:nicotinamidase-related amidase